MDTFTPLPPSPTPRSEAETPPLNPNANTAEQAVSGNSSLDGGAPTKSKKGLLITLAVVTALAVAGYFAYPYLSRYLPTAPDTFLPPASSTPAAVPVQAYPPIENAKNLLVYLRNPDPNKPANYQAWIIDPATGAEEQLPLKGFVQAYKHYGSPELFYRPIGETGEWRVLDLSTGLEKSYTLITHPDPTAIENTSMDNFGLISPDGKYLVFQADFFAVCPSPSPFPSGFEGGFGPCQPEESLETPYGNYLYDLEERKATYLGSLDRVSRWDTTGHKLYYVDYGDANTTKVVDLQTKLVSTIDHTPNFGYFTYPLLQSNQIVKQEGATGNSGTPAFSKITLLDLATQKSTDVDSAGGWGEIQPFITASPDEQNIIYVRTSLVGDGIQSYHLYRYNLAEGKSTRLTPEDNSTSYRIYGAWLDNHTFVTSVDTIEATSYTNVNNYLVKIDLQTGQLTRLTSHDKVFSFNTQ